jgi:cysteine synthase
MEDKTMPMTWENPFYSRMPDPIGMVVGSDYEMPVTRVTEKVLSPGLHGKGIQIYALNAFFAPPGTGKRVPVEKMYNTALASGVIKPGATFVEPTSGGTGIALAFMAQRNGHKVVTIVSDRMVEGKFLPLIRHGAIVLRESQVMELLGLTVSPGSIELARLYAEKTGAHFLNQYWNPNNAAGWEELVAPQIWDMLGDKMTAAFFALGSTGTMRGLGGYFKKKNPDLQIVATMPYLSQEIGGTRDRRRLKEVMPWEDLIDFQDVTDFRVARALSAELFATAGSPAGESAGAEIGILDHYYLEQLARGTLQSENVAFMVFIDIFVPYVKMA